MRVYSESQVRHKCRNYCCIACDASDCYSSVFVYDAVKFYAVWRRRMEASGIIEYYVSVNVTCQ